MDAQHNHTALIQAINCRAFRAFDQGTIQQKHMTPPKIQRPAIQQHPTLGLFRFITPNLHDSLPRSLTHNRTRILPIYNLPNALARFS